MKAALSVSIVIILSLTSARGQTPPSIVIDHLDTDITALTESAIDRAKAKLHIAYGHTSHGSQLTTGMSGLVGFANGGALDLHDYAMAGNGLFLEFVEPLLLPAWPFFPGRR